MPSAPSEESLAVSSLFHDVCKVNLYKTEKRNQKIDGVWQEVPVYVIDEKYHFGGHGSKSVFLVQQFMESVAYSRKDGKNVLTMIYKKK